MSVVTETTAGRAEHHLDGHLSWERFDEIIASAAGSEGYQLIEAIDGPDARVRKLGTVDVVLIAVLDDLAGAFVYSQNREHDDRAMQFADRLDRLTQSNVQPLSRAR